MWITKARAGETIRVSGPATIKVIAMGGSNGLPLGRVKIGIDAPKSTVIQIVEVEEDGHAADQETVG